MSYDPKCYDLAEAFLEDEDDKLNTAANIDRIAQRIQDNIEDEILRIRQDADYAIEAAKDSKWQALLDERRGK
jgi:hypothetical protein